MRRLIKTVLLVAVFLGGYYLGGLPGRPDIIGWAGGVWSDTCVIDPVLTGSSTYWVESGPFSWNNPTFP